MITSIILDRLPSGSLPIFDGPGQETHFALTNFGWEQRFNSLERLWVAMELDTTLEEFEPKLRTWVEEAQHLVDGMECIVNGANVFPQDRGTLVFVINVLAEIPDQNHFGHLLIGGLAYMPIPLEYAVDLQGNDPADLILRMCREEWDHPILQETFARQERLREDRQRGWRQLREAERKEKETFDRRAFRLLREHLSPQQRSELRQLKYFHVRAQNGELFRIYENSHQNVFKVDPGGVEVMQYCIVAGDIPTYDLMLAQKLLLETNFETFLRIANKWKVLSRTERERIPRGHMEEIYAIEDARVFELAGMGIELPPLVARAG